MNFKGQNRRMFRKPGAAKRALGILASSQELANTVEPMRMADGGSTDAGYTQAEKNFLNFAYSYQPTKSGVDDLFAEMNGGKFEDPVKKLLMSSALMVEQGMPVTIQGTKISDGNAMRRKAAAAARDSELGAPNPLRMNVGGLAEILDYNPGFEEDGTPSEGVLGMYQRASGIGDAERARDSARMDLLKFGARLASGQSGNLLTDLGTALTGSIDDLGARRKEELASELTAAKLRREMEKEEADRQYKKEVLALDKEYKTGSLAISGQKVDLDQREAEQKRLNDLAGVNEETISAVRVIGGDYDVGTGKYLLPSKDNTGFDTYDTYGEAVKAMNPQQRKAVTNSLLDSVANTESERYQNLLSSPNPETLGKAVSAVNTKHPKFNESDIRTKQILYSLSARGLTPVYKGSTLSGGEKIGEMDGKKYKVTYDLYGNITKTEEVVDPKEE